MKAKMLYRNCRGFLAPYKVVDCLCPDGLRRVANITGEPDTWFYSPARVQVRRKSVSGFITSRDDDIEFIPYAYRKNHDAFKTNGAKQ